MIIWDIGCEKKCQLMDRSRRLGRLGARLPRSHQPIERDLVLSLETIGITGKELFLEPKLGSTGLDLDAEAGDFS